LSADNGDEGNVLKENAAILSAVTGQIDLPQSDEIAYDDNLETSDENDNSRNAIYNDKEILQVANSEDDVLGLAILSLSCEPVEISVGQTIQIHYEVDTSEKGIISIKIGDISRMYPNCDPKGTIDFTYDGAKRGLLTGSFRYYAESYVDDEFQVTVTDGPGSKTIYVNSSKASSGNGTSDAEAFMSLKEALDNSINGDTIMMPPVNTKELIM
jgi:hypothetical protein